MKSVSIVPYDPSIEKQWNEFNRHALNGHFLFDRGFIGYHGDRFIDASLVVLWHSEIAAIFPANRAGGQLRSHEGLTFGGLVHGDDLRVEAALEILEAIGDYAKAIGIETIVYKAMPAIYNRAPADTGLYALFRHDAVCRRRDATATIDYRAPGQRSRRRRRAVRKSHAAGLDLVWDDAGWWEYWQLLSEMLDRRHGRRPVHTADEIRLLATRFPENIKLFVARQDGLIVAGVVIFETPYVAHAQYIAADPRGQELAALDAIFDYLIGFYSQKKRYFDFGISTEDEGRYLNAGLADYKQEWGSGCVVQDTYQWTV